MSKASLKAELTELQAYRQVSERIFGFLVSNEYSELILRELRNGKSLEGISEVLAKRELPLDLPAWTGNTTSPGDKRWSGGGSASVKIPDARHSISVKQLDVAMDVTLVIEPWTQVTTDTALMDHLISLYFCWEYPIFTTLSRKHFLDDFHSGKRRYCSSLLVNCILAVGYQLSSDSVRNSDSTANSNDFSKEARRLLEVEQEIPSITTIQALGILSLLKASQDGSETSTFYCGQAIRMAIEMGLHLNFGVAQFPDAEREVRRATAWGAFSLDQ